jgi:hypothetical protein
LNETGLEKVKKGVKTPDFLTYAETLNQWRMQNIILGISFSFVFRYMHLLRTHFFARIRHAERMRRLFFQ